MDVKPWDMKSWSWIMPGNTQPSKMAFDPKEEPICIYMEFEHEKSEPWAPCVTLANGQRIIVRVLSDERKAARHTRLMRTVE